MLLLSPQSCANGSTLQAPTLTLEPEFWAIKHGLLTDQQQLAAYGGVSNLLGLAAFWKQKLYSIVTAHAWVAVKHQSLMHNQHLTPRDQQW